MSFPMMVSLIYYFNDMSGIKFLHTDIIIPQADPFATDELEEISMYHRFYDFVLFLLNCIYLILLAEKPEKSWADIGDTLAIS
jgi:hypothetical protein